jgi:hypothetical protein
MQILFQFYRKPRSAASNLTALTVLVGKIAVKGYGERKRRKVGEYHYDDITNDENE